MRRAETCGPFSSYGMSFSRQHGDGLLLLLQAAQKLAEDGPKRACYSEAWEQRSGQRVPHDVKYPIANSYAYGSPGRPISTLRCTHNELEKSRRAHLRACMETLKEHLHFDNDIPRITMLTVLKKATSTIEYLRQRNQCLETCEDNEKQRCAQLIKRREILKKKLLEKRNRSLKLQSWRERNRNCSECSINTTSSDDSEVDPHFRHIGHPEYTSSHGPCSAFSRMDAIGLGASCLTSKTKNVHVLGTYTRPPSRLDCFDTSSSDSGYEEITIGSNGITSSDENSRTSQIGDSSPCHKFRPKSPTELLSL
ncbi:unnamed protein product [Dicrocoelium dendriticum]|nr:unnamed protein product [Dicrocoelium dendriticum]